MSDTPVTVETEIIETPEAVTEIVEATEETPEVAVTADAPVREDRSDRRGAASGDRKPRSRDRGGMREEEKEFKEEMLSIDRVTRVTAGGRQLRFRASIVIGDGKGRIGLGIGKSGEVQGAIEKAIRDAKKNLITFPIVNGTIPHDVAVNFKSSSLFLHPAHPGTGIIAGGAVRKIMAVSGIKDIIAKQHGAPNGITNARVTMKALSLLKPTHLVKNFSKVVSSDTTEAVATPTDKKSAPAKKPATKKAPAKKSAE
jgi:small subunit ribosomal protein S5